jgi:hypothetical protein
MLQLLDGACNASHLFILTVNNLHNLNDNLINRPSRIFYRRLYDSVPDSVINEILDAELINQNWREEMLQVFDKFTSITFDIIMALVSEVNRYDESPLECAKMMNFTPQHVFVKKFQIHKDGTRRDLGSETLSFAENEFETRIYESSKANSDFNWYYVKIKDLVKTSPTSWTYRHVNGDVIELIKSSPISLLF